VTDIRQAHQLLDGALGSTIAATLFAVALLASGQNATITGTLAGQIVLEGFLKIKGKAWMVRTLTRLAALVPALFVIAYAGEGKAVELLLWSQVILSLQLGFACWPLVSITCDSHAMGDYVAPRWIKLLGITATFIVISASLWFVRSVI
jgi:manganese transport protein